MTPLQTAIADMKALLASLGNGQTGAKRPKEGSVEWFKIRAVAIGLSTLRRMEQQGMADRPEAADRVYKDQLKEMKALDLADAP